MKSSVVLAVLILIIGLGIPMVEASIIYDLVSVAPVGTTGNFDYTYSAVLSGDQKIGRVGAFSVIYDFPGLVPRGVDFVTSVSSVPGIIAVTSFPELVTTPQPADQSVPDNPAITNIRTSIALTPEFGVFFPEFVPTVDTPIFLIIARSTFPSGALLVQSAQALKNVPGDPSNGTVSGNSVRVEGPTTIVPEPMTLLLIGTGLAALGFVRRRRRGSSNSS
jgi:hypothetical protein